MKPFGKLSVAHEILSKLYNLAFCLEEESMQFTKEEVMEAIYGITMNLEELIELIGDGY